MTNDNRNPVIIPDKGAPRRKCPHCGGFEFNGRSVQGVVTFTCKSCHGKWDGGIGQVPQDPSVPMMGEYPAPPIVHVPVRDKDGNVVKIEEISRKVDSTQSFRKGAPIPEDEDY
jgi:hypothetical protein